MSHGNCVLIHLELQLVVFFVSRHVIQYEFKCNGRIKCSYCWRLTIETQWLSFDTAMNICLMVPHRLSITILQTFLKTAERKFRQNLQNRLFCLLLTHFIKDVNWKCIYVGVLHAKWPNLTTENLVPHNVYSLRQDVAKTKTFEQTWCLHDIFPGNEKFRLYAPHKLKRHLKFANWFR